MKRMMKKSLALLLCAALVALGLSALLFSCHHCSGETCAVCLAIGEALRLSRAAAVMSAAAAAFVLLAGFVGGNNRLMALRSARTLVSMKTELLN